MSNWYHCSVKPISRSAGRSVVAAAAYRIGKSLYDERTQTLHDYQKRKGVETSFIITPANAPDWANDPEQLWNAAEQAENRINSRTAREVELALPSAVGKSEREQISRELAEHLSERYSVAVMVALHEPSKHGDERNYHAHILMTTRRMDANGLGNKTRELDDQKQGKAEILHIREYVAALINKALAQAGHSERIDHRSFKDRGIEQIPTEHLGVDAAAMERKGKKSRIGDHNRDVQQANQRTAELTQELKEINRQIEQAQKRSATYCQDYINAERQRQDDGDAGNQQVKPKPLEPITYLSIFNEPSLEQHKAQLLETGEIKHKGLVMSWVEHAADLIRDLSHEVKATTKTIWERFTESYNPDKTQGNEIER